MKRLDILLMGASQAMTDLALELEQHGHTLQRSGATHSKVDLIIDDGFIAAGDFCRIPHLHLRLGVGAQSRSGLPILDLLCFLGSTLISRVPIGDERPAMVRHCASACWRRWWTKSRCWSAVSPVTPTI